MIIITPETIVNKGANKLNAKSVFLAGTIDNGDSLNWQDKVIMELINLGIECEVFNPRREHWNPNPTKTEIYAMYAAERITPANIKATGEFTGKAVDTLIEKILKASKAMKD